MHGKHCGLSRAWGVGGVGGIIPKSNKRIMEIHKIASMRLAQYQYVQQQQQQEQQQQLPTHIWLLRAAHGRVNWGRQRMRWQKRSQMSIQGMQSLHTRSQSVCGLSSNLPAEYLPDGYHTHTYICTHTHTYTRTHSE